MTKLEEPLVRGFVNRVLQLIAQFGPGSSSLRVWLHRARGVTIGPDVFIGLQVIIETSFPQLVRIGAGAQIGHRVTILAHERMHPEGADRDYKGVQIGDHVVLGPGAIVLPNITIGDGAVVAAGSVVKRSVPPLTVVEGVPAEPIAVSKIPLSRTVSVKEFARQLRPIRRDGR